MISVKVKSWRVVAGFGCLCIVYVPLKRACTTLQHQVEHLTLAQLTLDIKFNCSHCEVTQDMKVMQQKWSQQVAAEVFLNGRVVHAFRKGVGTNERCVNCPLRPLEYTVPRWQSKRSGYLAVSQRHFWAIKSYQNSSFFFVLHPRTMTRLRHPAHLHALVPRFLQHVPTVTRRSERLSNRVALKVAL